MSQCGFFFPTGRVFVLQDTTYQRAKDVQEFQDAVLSQTRRGGFGLDGQDAAELAFADKSYKAPPPKEGVRDRGGSFGLAPCGTDARWRTRGTFVRIRSEESTLRSGFEGGSGYETLGEPQHGGELAASGQPLGELGKAQRSDPATKATEVECGQPQVQPVDQTGRATRSAEYLKFLAEAEMKAVDPDQWLMDDSDADDVENIPDRVAAVLTGHSEAEATRSSRCPKAAPRSVYSFVAVDDRAMSPRCQHHLVLGGSWDVFLASVVSFVAHRIRLLLRVSPLQSSSSSEVMDRAAAALLGPNHLLGQQRYRLATTTIPGNDGDISLRIGEGGLMGDPLMVALFWVAFLPSTIRWQQLVAEEGVESGHLLAWHPWSGERMDLSLSQYADDTTKQIVAKPGEDVQALAKRVQCSNDVFDRALAVGGFSQNRGKEELLMHLVGEGSFADRRLVRDGKVSLPGKVVTVARHLGSHLGEKASFTHELPRRRQATMAAFYSVGQLRCESRTQNVASSSVVWSTRHFLASRLSARRRHSTKLSRLW